MTVNVTEPLTHAGGVVVRTDGGEPRVLLVRATPPPHNWVLPKGHIKKQETPEEAARREVREEAGVDAEAIAFLGRLNDYSIGDKLVRAGFFLMRFLRDVPPEEEREIRWCRFDEATRLVAFEDTRRLILEASRRS